MPWFLFSLVSLVIVLRTWRRPKSARPASRWSAVASAVMCLLLAFVFWPGRFYAEKMLTDLALPLGFVWFGLLVTAVAVGLIGNRWQVAIAIAAACTSLSLAGNYLIANAVMTSLERPYLAVDPLDEEPFEVICVLGGGAWIDYQGRPTVGPAGDRIVVAARLYRDQKSPLLLCTGGDLRPAPNLPTAAEMTAGVLTDLGVPRDDLLFGGGDTTRSELAAIGRVIDEKGWKRVGVVTSAWHMPRVERLARAAGVELVPLPADFESPAESDLPTWDRIRRFSIIPNAGALEQTHAGIKEYLAALAGR